MNTRWLALIAIAVALIGTAVSAETYPHWPRAGEDVTIPILVYNYDSTWRAESYQLVAQAAEAWSASERVNLIIVGEIPNPDEVCIIPGGAYNHGYISYCMGTQTTGAITSTFRDCPPLDDGECWSEHFRAAKVTHYSPLPRLN